MKAKDVESIIEGESALICRALYLGNWDIKFKTERLEIGVTGRCNADSRYQHATIILDPEQIDDEAEALKVLRHELIHVVLAEFDIPFESARDELQSNEGRRLLFEIQRNAVERSVVQIERILDHGLGATPLLIGDMARRVKGEREGATT